jgi:hypothetical protein
MCNIAGTNVANNAGYLAEYQAEKIFSLKQRFIEIVVPTCYLL